jgi:inner membrane transporter RhtA
MNASFYLAISRLPLGTVGAIEFLGPVSLAALGVRSARNLVALMLAVTGVALLTDARLEGEWVGFALAFFNCALFTVYIVLGHRLAQQGGSAVDRLASAMIVASLVITPLGIRDAMPAVSHSELLLAGFGVGVCSSVVPYVCDQLAMARLPRATFALLLALLPASAVIIGLVVLRQRPQAIEVAAVGLIVLAVGLHRDTRQ